MSISRAFTDTELTASQIHAEIDAIRVQALRLNFRTAASKAMTLSTLCLSAGLDEAASLANKAFSAHVRPAILRGDGHGIKLPNWGDYLAALSDVERAAAEAS